jgi:integrase
LSCAALLAGAPIASIQAALGHHSISTTARYLSQAASLVAPAHLLVVADLIAKEPLRSLSPKPTPITPRLPLFQQISRAERSP